MGEGLANPVERELCGHQALEPELRHERERAPVRRAAAERADDLDLAEVDVPEIERQPASLRVHADELEDAGRLRQGDRLRDQLGLADRLADDLGAAAAGELHHLVAQAFAGRIDDHIGPETPRHLAALRDRIGHDQPFPAPSLRQGHRDEPHDAAADDEHGGAARYLELLEPGEAAGGRLGHRRGDRIEPAGQRVNFGDRQHHALGEAADANAFRALAHAPGGTFRALTAAVGRFAADRAPDESLADAPAHPADDAGVLVAEDERRLPREEPLRRVNVGAADSGGAHRDDDLAGPGDGLGHLVDRESVLPLPGCDVHVCTSALSDKGSPRTAGPRPATCDYGPEVPESIIPVQYDQAANADFSRVRLARRIPRTAWPSHES